MLAAERKLRFKKVSARSLRKIRIANNTQHFSEEIKNQEQQPSEHFESLKINEHEQITISVDEKPAEEQVEFVPEKADSVRSKQKKKPNILLPELMVGSMSIEKAKEEGTKSDNGSQVLKVTSKDISKESISSSRYA